MQQKTRSTSVINLVNLRLINNLNSTLVRGNIPTTKGKANKTEVYKMSKSKIANAKNAKEYTIQFLSTHSTASRSELLSSMRCEMPDMSYSILGGALHQLCKNGDIVSIERGVYSLGVSKCEDDPFICSMKNASHCLEAALANAMKELEKCRLTIDDFGDMDACIEKSKLLVEAHDFLDTQLKKIKSI